MGVRLSLLVLAGCEPLSNTEPIIETSPLFTHSASVTLDVESTIGWACVLDVPTTTLLVPTATEDHRWPILKLEGGGDGLIPETAVFSNAQEDEVLSSLTCGAEGAVAVGYYDRDDHTAEWVSLLDVDLIEQNRIPVPEDFGGIASGGRRGFGSATAYTDLSGDGGAELIVGMPYADRNDPDLSGAVYLYDDRLVDPVLLTHDETGTSGGLQTFGAALDAGGDTDGDGLAELVVSGQANGVVDIFSGDPSGLIDPVPHRIRRSNGALSPTRMGLLVRFVGDINGDGYDELLTAHEFDTENGTHITDYTGQARLFYGTVEGVDAESEQKLYQDGYHLFGNDAEAADLDGDGFSDLVISAMDLQNSLDGQGDGSTALFVFRGGNSGITADDAVPMSWEGQEATGWEAEIAVGDLGGDPGPDVAILQHDLLSYWLTGLD